LTERSRSARAPRPAVDLNADLGESFGVYRYGEDEAMMRLITSANVACGFHAGDPQVMRDTVRVAAERNVRIGAHVGLPDLAGFGRRFLRISAAEAYAMTLYQVGALDGFLRSESVPMTHVKPHGALYMTAATDRPIADAIVAAVSAFDPSLELYALPGSALAQAGADAGLVVVNEYFADRPYSGSEVTMFGWTYEQIGGPEDAAGRVDRMLHDPRFAEVRTVCVHSDTRDAPVIMRAVAAVVRSRNDPTRTSASRPA
jgi:UPF0271 protein